MQELCKLKSQDIKKVTGFLNKELMQSDAPNNRVLIIRLQHWLANSHNNTPILKNNTKSGGQKEKE
ncbi:hypothetical protein [Borreliella tanukii]|uniref:hypothetical protein n=1 Tax=Borreliella tanukii TaxID=56146 RepID=UPI003AB9A45C